MTDQQPSKKMTANQLFKAYKDEGGTLNFAQWLNREKAKGVLEPTVNLNDEIKDALTKNEDMNKTVLGLPIGTLVLVGVVIVGAIVVANVMKKRA
jgi:hypothetical protein